MSPAKPTGADRRSHSATIGVIGAGYVGLPTAAILAHYGHSVVCADNNSARVAALRRGDSPIVEEGLEDLLREGIAQGRLRFVERAEDAVAGAGFVFLCVPTPQGQDGSADLSYVEAAAHQLAPVLEPGAVVVNKSTVPVGSALLVEQIIGRADVTVVSNPEFLREGTAVHDSLHPDRIIVGGDDQSAAAKVGRLFVDTGAPLIVTDTTTAETIKYASNAFLATKLSFVNAMAALCEAVGADVRDLTLGLGYDHRIGFEYLRPGPGWGGSCLPKDTRALVHIADEAGYDFALLRGAIETNDDQLARVLAKVVESAGGAVHGVPLAVWGLSFKAGTDDRRSSPAVDIVHRLLASGAEIRAFDPTVSPTGASGGAIPGSDAEDLGGIALCGDPYEACRGARVLVVLTEWEEFRWVDFAKVGDLMERPVVVDARNLLDPGGMRRLGFTYSGIGRP